MRRGTRDGIAACDWDIVTSLAAEIANSVCERGNNCAAETATKKLLQQLARLEEKYGRLPSIVATQADYVNDVRERVRLLEDAWILAKNTRDNVNLVFIASSLAETFIDELEDQNNGRKWLERLEDGLGNNWHDGEYRQVNQLRQRLEALSR